MSSDAPRGNLVDVRFRAVGVGLDIRWLCFGCNKQRSALGSKGAGVRKRCSACVVARATKWTA